MRAGSPKAPMTPTRIEHDSFGPIDVPADALWGAQTARSLRFFAIGQQRMPIEVVHALAWIKWAAAGVNRDLHRIDAVKAGAIADAARRVAAGEFDVDVRTPRSIPTSAAELERFDFFMLPFLDRVRNQAGFLVGGRGVVMLFLEHLKGVVNGFGLRVGVRIWHDNQPLLEQK